MPTTPDIHPGPYVLDTHALFAFLQRETGENLVAARVKAHHAVSYADAFAVALAQELGATLVSGDPEIRALRGLVPVLWVETV